MTTIIIPTFRGVKAFPTVTTVGVTPGGLVTALILVHPTGTVVTTTLGTTSKKIKRPLGDLVFPATESLVHYRFIAGIASCLIRECGRLPTKKVGITTISLITPARPIIHPGAADGYPGTSSED